MNSSSIEWNEIPWVKNLKTLTKAKGFFGRTIVFIIAGIIRIMGVLDASCF